MKPGSKRDRARTNNSNTKTEETCSFYDLSKLSEALNVVDDEVAEASVSDMPEATIVKHSEEAVSDMPEATTVQHNENNSLYDFSKLSDALNEAESKAKRRLKPRRNTAFKQCQARNSLHASYNLPQLQRHYHRQNQKLRYEELTSVLRDQLVWPYLVSSLSYLSYLSTLVEFLGHGSANTLSETTSFHFPGIPILPPFRQIKFRRASQKIGYASCDSANTTSTNTDRAAQVFRLMTYRRRVKKASREN